VISFLLWLADSLHPCFHDVGSWFLPAVLLFGLPLYADVTTFIGPGAMRLGGYAAAG
jgi:hypothetical protein